MSASLSRVVITLLSLGGVLRVNIVSPLPPARTNLPRHDWGLSNVTLLTFLRSQQGIYCRRVEKSYNQGTLTPDKKKGSLWECGWGGREGGRIYVLIEVVDSL